MLLFSSQFATAVLRHPDAGLQVKTTSRQKQALGAAFVASRVSGHNAYIRSVPRPVPTAHTRLLHGVRHGYKAKLISCSRCRQGTSAGYMLTVLPQLTLGPLPHLCL